MENLAELTNYELIEIEGGSFFEDLAYGIAYTVHSAYRLTQALGSDSRYGDAMYYK